MFQEQIEIIFILNWILLELLSQLSSETSLQRFSELLTNPIDMIIGSNENGRECSARSQWPRSYADDFTVPHDGSSGVADACSLLLSRPARDGAEHLIRNVICGCRPVIHEGAEEIGDRCHHQLLHLISAISNRRLQHVKVNRIKFYYLIKTLRVQLVPSLWKSSETWLARNQFLLESFAPSARIGFATMFESRRYRRAWRKPPSFQNVCNPDVSRLEEPDEFALLARGVLMSQPRLRQAQLCLSGCNAPPCEWKVYVIMPSEELIARTVKIERALIMDPPQLNIPMWMMPAM